MTASHWKWAGGSLLALLVVCTAACSLYPARSRETPEEILEELSARGPGVYRVEHDGHGRLTGCLIVGQARVSEVLGAPKGEMAARSRAIQDAQGRFVEWLRGHARAVELRGDLAVVAISASGEWEREGAVSRVEISESQIDGAVRSMELLARRFDGDPRVLSVLFAWKPAFPEAIAGAGDKAPSSAVAPVQPRPSGEGEREEASSLLQLTDDAKEFL